MTAYSRRNWLRAAWAFLLAAATSRAEVTIKGDISHWLINRLRDGTLKKGDDIKAHLPIKPGTYSESYYQGVDRRYGVSVYCRMQDRIILVLYTTTDKGSRREIVHSAGLLTGAHGLGLKKTPWRETGHEEHWFFYDKDLLAQHIAVSIQVAENRAGLLAEALAEQGITNKAERAGGYSAGDNKVND